MGRAGRDTMGLADDLDAAFEELVRVTQDDVFSGVLRLAQSRAEAEELTQETFVAAYRALRGYDRERIRQLQLRPWLWTIALNLCRNDARRRSRRPVTVALQDEGSNLGVGPDRVALAAALAELPEPMRVAVVLQHVVDLPVAEVAEVLGKPVGTVKSDVHRGLQRLRVLLDEEVA
jgi:DNA-directed RNA polymerase specialized sigma24 family protein